MSIFIYIGGINFSHTFFNRYNWVYFKFFSLLIVIFNSIKSSHFDEEYWSRKRTQYVEKFGKLTSEEIELSESEKNNILNFLLEDYDRTQRAGIDHQLNLSAGFYVQGLTREFWHNFEEMFGVLRNVTDQRGRDGLRNDYFHATILGRWAVRSGLKRCGIF